MSERACSDCGDYFEAKADYHRLCWRCWRERENIKLEDAAYDRGYNRGHENGYRLGHKDGLRDGRERANGSRPALDAGLLRALVTLCHPDRHPPERFEMANRATASLLGLLRAER
jgi:hypothetical protein